MEAKERPRVKTFSWVWPAVESLEGAKAATRQGFWAAIFCASLTVILSLLGVLGIQVFREYGLEFDLWSLFDVGLYGLIAWAL